MTARWAGLLVLFLLPSVLFAQEIVVIGRVVDPQGNALPEASLKLLQQNKDN